MDPSQHPNLGATAPSLPDTSSEKDRDDLMLDILRLPMPQFQAICCAVRNNTPPEDLAKMMSAWTEQRVRANIFETMAALEERANILSSSYQDRMQHQDTVPEVQVAPVTKEVFGKVLDSMKDTSPDDPKTESKHNFITYVQGMVDKIRGFPKSSKTAPKAASQTEITTAACEDLSALLGSPEPQTTSSSTSLNDIIDRLCTEDGISRASVEVGSLLRATGSTHDVDSYVVSQGSSSLTLTSIVQEQDDARGIVGTIVTDLEDLYGSLEPDEVEMLQCESPPTQEQPPEKEATMKKIHQKLCSILCSAQLKLRMFFTLHRSQDILPDSTCPVQSQVDTEDHADGLLPTEEYITSECDEQKIINADSEPSGHSLPEETEPPTQDPQQPKEKRFSIGKGLKIFFAENRSSPRKPAKECPNEAETCPEMTLPLEDNQVDQGAMGTEPELESDPASCRSSPEFAVVEVVPHYIIPTPSPSHSMHSCDEDTTLGAPSEELCSDVPVTTKDKDKTSVSLSFKEKFKSKFTGLKGSREVSPVVDDTRPSEVVEPVSREELTSFQDGVSVGMISASTGLGGIDDLDLDSSTYPDSLSQGTFVLPPLTDDEEKEIISNDNRGSLKRKIKGLFSKSPKPCPSPPGTTVVNIPDTAIPDFVLPGTTSEEDTAIMDSVAGFEMPQSSDSSHSVMPESPTCVTEPEGPTSDDSSGGIGKRLKNLFNKRPKSFSCEPAIPAVLQDETECAEMCPVISETEYDMPQSLEASHYQIDVLSASSLETQTCVTEPEGPTSDDSSTGIGKKLQRFFSKRPKSSSCEPAMLPVRQDEPVENADISPEIIVPEFSLYQSPNQAQAPLSFNVETQTRFTASEDDSSDDSSRNFSRKFKQFFHKQPKSSSYGPALPAVLLDEAEENAVTSNSPVPVAIIVEDKSQQYPEDLHKEAIKVSPVACSDIEPSSELAAQKPQKDHVSFGARLKQLFFHPAQPPISSSDDPKECISGTSDVEGFRDIEEAAAALKDVTEGIIQHKDDPATAKVKLDHLIARGVLRPFTDNLVNQVFTFMSTGTAPPLTEPSRCNSESNIPRAKSGKSHKRELVVDCDSEMAYAFAEQSIKALLRQILESLLPLTKGADTRGNHVLDAVTDIMAKEVTSTISFDELRVQRSKPKVNGTTDTKGSLRQDDTTINADGKDQGKRALSPPPKTQFPGILGTLFKPSKTNPTTKN